jgi:hypothetical protein
MRRFRRDQEPENLVVVGWGWGNTVTNYAKGLVLKKQIVAQLARILLPFSQLTVAGPYLKPN